MSCFVSLLTLLYKTIGLQTRFRKEFIEETPAPDCYQTKCTEPMEFETAYKPFSYASERFPVTRRDVEEATPGYASLFITVRNKQTLATAILKKNRMWVYLELYSFPLFSASAYLPDFFYIIKKIQLLNCHENNIIII